ncbi:MAG: Fibronectin/fibrinogen-binding protein [Brockia lithotrophica]|uniref:Fibronectin/fibrinogen-binding protein n=1 Tax=Brockia lithotrophica TaxID=933949 RepID=A0A2T5G6E6_9BACL|nr:MAG: Fibronectin/fibrinogen-binding protein [Brockia lithotrophica]
MLDGLGIARLLSELTPHLGRKIYRVEFADPRTFLVVHAGGSLVFFLDPQTPLFFAMAPEEELGKELLRRAQAVRKEIPQTSARLLPWRRALEGGILARAEQLARDRVFALGVEVRSQTGERQLLRLVAELVPRYANLLLVDAKGGILAVFRPVEAGMSRYRRLVPGGRYTPPPPLSLPDLLHLTPAELAARVRASRSAEDLRKVGAGIGRDTACALWSHLAAALRGPDVDEVVLGERAYRLLHDAVAGKTPAAFAAPEAGGRPYLSPLCPPSSEGPSFPPLPAEDENARGEKHPAEVEPLACLPPATSFGCAETPTMHEAVRRTFLYLQKSRSDERRARLLRRLEEREEFLALQRRELERAVREGEEAEHEREAGELLLAYAMHVPSGAASVLLPPPGESGEPREILLDPALDAAENAARYFARYRKKKNAARHAAQRIEEVRAEEEYLASLRFALLTGNGRDLDEVEEEMRAQGLLGRRASRPPGAEGTRQIAEGAAGRTQGTRPKTARKDGNRKPEPLPQPLRLRSSAGTEIWVGRNNAQNDALTFRLADRRDVWLHARGIPGAHVVVRSPNPDPATLEEAAMLAAYFSTGRDSGSVAVDVTDVRSVRKPRGARPGFVTYRNERTLHVTVDVERVWRLLEHAAGESALSRTPPGSEKDVPSREKSEG